MKDHACMGGAHGPGMPPKPPRPPASERRRAHPAPRELVADVAEREVVDAREAAGHDALRLAHVGQDQETGRGDGGPQCQTHAEAEALRRPREAPHQSGNDHLRRGEAEDVVHQGGGCRGEGPQVRGHGGHEHARGDGQEGAGAEEPGGDGQQPSGEGRRSTADGPGERCEGHEGACHAKCRCVMSGLEAVHPVAEQRADVRAQRRRQGQQ
mmetsp:Transcript_109770/g.328186  ORF Transcript_109770/g.328186 Transcript_109770/m.328186 type:complete len:211 (+) Transcript_109770:231-863(+)